MLTFSYKALPQPHITMHSRTSYLGYLGALDMSVGWRLALGYLKDAAGNEKSGVLSTSRVVKIDSTPSLDEIKVTTLNSIYTLTKA